jgi:quercetin dioxygenase-like cupin family protein
LTFNIGGESRTLHAGDTYVIPSNVPHDAVTGPQGCVVIDVFAPVRADWESVEQVDPAPSAWKMDR